MSGAGLRSPPDRRINGVHAEPATLPGGWLPQRAVPRVLLAPAVVAAWSAMELRFGLGWSLPAMVVWSGGLMLLAAIDADRMVLPSRVVYATLALTLVGLALASSFGAGWGRLAAAVACRGGGGRSVRGLGVGRAGVAGLWRCAAGGSGGLGLGWSSPPWYRSGWCWARRGQP